MYGGISRGLQPLTRLQAQLGDRQLADLSALSPIEMTQAPHEVHALAAAVNQLLSAVRRSRGQEKRFLSDAAHQLRTPLAGLISQTELALTESDPVALRERQTKVLSGAPVSYTHLDVYKRQALARRPGSASPRPQPVCRDAQWLFRAAQCLPDEHRGPVSYTHLDVYKRQHHALVGTLSVGNVAT